MNTAATPVSCIILAGGEGKRAGGLDKGLVNYQDKPLIEHVITAINNQVDDIVISANRNVKTYQQYTAKVISDAAEHYQGPLAGIAACLKHCQHEQVLVIACDMPGLPSDLVERLYTPLQNQDISIATVDNHHQLAMILKQHLSRSIQHCLDNNLLKLIQWVESVPYTTVNFDDVPKAFTNLNHLSKN